MRIPDQRFASCNGTAELPASPKCSKGSTAACCMDFILPFTPQVSVLFTTPQLVQLKMCFRRSSFPDSQQHMEPPTTTQHPYEYQLWKTPCHPRLLQTPPPTAPATCSSSFAALDRLALGAWVFQTKEE